MAEPRKEPASSNLPQRIARPAGGALATLPTGPPAWQEHPSLHRYLHVLAGRKWLFLAVLGTVLVATALQVLTTTPLFVSSAMLQIDPEDPKVLPFEEVDDSASQLWLGEYLWTQVEKLQSPGLAQRVVRRLELGEDPSFNAPLNPGILYQGIAMVSWAMRLPGRLAASEAPSAEHTEDADQALLADRLLAGLEVRPLRDTRLIHVTYRSADPVLSARIANAFAEEFIEQHLEKKYEAARRATEFLRGQLDDLKVRVEESERALLDYARENQILNLSERVSTNRKKLADLNDEVTRAEALLIEKRTIYEASKAAADGAVADSLESAEVRALEAQLVRTEQELASLRERFGEEWPSVKEVIGQRETLRAQLEAERQAIPAGARREYELARDRYARLSAALDQQRRSVNQLDESSIQYNILKREVDSNKELYEGLLQRLKEAGVAAGLRSSNIGVANEARPARSASYPRKALSMALAALMGSLLALTSVFLTEAIDNTIKNQEEVGSVLGLPALGTIPTIQVEGAKGRRRSLFRRRPDESDMAILAFWDSSSQGAIAREAYRSVRTSILLSQSTAPPQTILVTSALPSDGKTTTAINTACALAQTGSKTLLVDLDLRRPSLAEVFGLNAEEGFSTYLSGNTDLSSRIFETSFPNLLVVPAGPPAPNPAELIGSEKMDTGLELLREYFTYIVIDSTPTLEVTDALVVSPRVDGVILVARAGKTPRGAIRKSADQLLRVGATLLGVLTNDVPTKKREYGYYYGKYGGYRYSSYVAEPREREESG